MADGKGKARIEGGVTRVGRALHDLGRVFEAHGHEIEEKQIQAVFAFIAKSLNDTRQKALLSRSTAAASGGFSLDNIPSAGPTETMQWLDGVAGGPATVREIQMPAGTQQSIEAAGGKIHKSLMQGRLAGSRGKPVFAFEPEKPSTRPAPVVADTADADFIDE